MLFIYLSRKINKVPFKKLTDSCLVTSQDQRRSGVKMLRVGFEPTQLTLTELESVPLDRSGISASCQYILISTRL